jgi:hypothetical protein
MPTVMHKPRAELSQSFGDARRLHMHWCIPLREIVGPHRITAAAADRRAAGGPSGCGEPSGCGS